MSSQSQAHLTLYNEERKQEGDFWYHLFFCDSNKAAVSQLGKYTVIIVYYSNCIMQKQMIFFPEKKICFPYDSASSPLKNTVYVIST